MSEFKVRLNPTETVTCADYAEACALADANYLYGAIVTDAWGKLLYAPKGEVSATILYNGKWVCDYIRDNAFVYGHAPINPAFNHDARIVSCDRLVDWILFRSGIVDQPVKHGKCCSGPPLTNWCIEHGFKKIETVEELEPGDVVFVRPSEKGDPLHVFIHAGKGEEEGKYYRYDGGSNVRIRSTQPSCEPISDFMYGYRAPAVMPSFDPKPSFTYDGVPFAWIRTENETANDRITYTLPDGLQLTVVYEFLPKYGIIKWTNYWSNPTDHMSGLISDLCDCDITVPMKGDAPRNRRNRQSTWEPKTMILHATNGAHARDDDHLDIPVRMWAGDHREEACQEGRSGLHRAPFFDAVDGDGERGYLIAIGWTGQWKAQFDRGEYDLRIRHGVQDVNLRLKPGESFRTASTTIMVYTDGQVNAHNRWRRYIREELSPFAKSQNGARGDQSPFSAIFWGGVPSEALKRRWNAIWDAKLPFNYCWIDAGWYEPLTYMTTNEQMANWPQIGTWEVSKFYHPEGYKDVAKLLHEHDCKFLVWFEPERTRRDIADWTGTLYRESPDENNVLVNLADDKVCDDVIEKISGMVQELELGCYRQDCNIMPLAFWRNNDRLENPEGERAGATEIHYINNLWRFWDALLERNPHLLIDNCAGGGHRLDIEMMSRSVPLWRSDFQCLWDCCPEANQNQNASAAWWYPYSGIGFGPTLGDTYMFRSAWTNGMTVRTWEHVDPEWEVGAMGEDLEWARHHFTEYNEVRHYFAEDYYRLVPVSKENTTWSASQYHKPDTGDGMILAFRRAMSPSDRIEVTLGGIEAGKNYEFTDRDTGDVFTMTGDELIAKGMTLTIPERRQSKLIVYRAL